MRTGALVISLDFELAWGVFDTLGVSGGYRGNLLGAREAIPRLLDLFAEFEINATWATVGLLFASSHDEALAFAPPPELWPTYRDSRKDPYRFLMASGRTDEKLVFAPELIRSIASAPGQELASHTFSHYYALEPGQDYASFFADLVSAKRIAESAGYSMRSLVIPRHQTRFDYLPAYLDAGFNIHRGNEPNVLNMPRSGRGGSLTVRGIRIADSYMNLTGHSLATWEQLRPQNGLQDIPESRFLRPITRTPEGLRRERIIAGIVEAARKKRVYHLWWHPHNFGHDVAGSISNIRTILEAFHKLRDESGIRSLHMAGAAETAIHMLRTT